MYPAVLGGSFYSNRTVSNVKSDNVKKNQRPGDGFGHFIPGGSRGGRDRTLGRMLEVEFLGLEKLCLLKKNKAREAF